MIWEWRRSLSGASRWAEGKSPWQRWRGRSARYERSSSKHHLLVQIVITDVLMTTVTMATAVRRSQTVQRHSSWYDVCWSRLSICRSRIIPRRVVSLPDVTWRPSSHRGPVSDLQLTSDSQEDSPVGHDENSTWHRSVPYKHRPSCRLYRENNSYNSLQCEIYKNKKAMLSQGNRAMPL